jgi:hypothetical protein
MARSDDAADGRLEAKPFGTRLPGAGPLIPSSSVLLGSGPSSRRRGLDIF